MGRYVDAPLVSILVHLLLNIICNFLSFLKEVLKNELATGILQNGIRDLGNSSRVALDSVEGISAVYDSVIDWCVNADGHVVFRNDGLPLQVHDVDLYIDHLHLVCAWVHIVQSRFHRLDVLSFLTDIVIPNRWKMPWNPCCTIWYG